MTITLHWWALPAALVVIAAVFVALSYRDRGGMLDGLGEGIVALFFVVCAAMIVLGHYL
jgi:hypothetical protein